MPHGTGHPLGCRREHEFGTEGLEHPPSLEAHALGHRDAEFVAAGRTHVGESDARVAAGGLDDHGLGADQAFPLCRIDHRAGDSILHAPERIHVLDLAGDGGDAALGDTPEEH